MIDITRFYYELIFENKYLRLTANSFQDFFADIMEKRYPCDFIRTRPWGSRGDEKSDGYLKSKRVLFQVYAPSEMKERKAIKKIKNDFNGALPYWKKYFDTWVFVHNARDGLGPGIIKTLLELDEAYPKINVTHWGFEEVRKEIFNLKKEDLITLFGLLPPLISTESIKKIAPFNQAVISYARKFADRHGKLKIIGMTNPVSLTDIYVQVNVLEKIPSWQCLSLDKIEAWEKSYSKHESFGKVIEKGINSLKLVNSNSHIMLLGQPGSGKTSFLRHIGLQALEGKLAHKGVPVFISLKELVFSTQTIFDFLVEEFDTCQFPDAELFIKQQLKNGKLLLLFDGLDEVEKSASKKISKEVNRFCDKYSQNRFIISCRTAAYTQNFPNFTDVELPEFNKKQVFIFIRKWFNEKKEKADNCIEKIQLPNNKPILELTKTPLLLALLCLTFNETQDFPKSKLSLYKDGINALLKKWDESRNIERHKIYRFLSLTCKREMLSWIAHQAFNKDKHFWRQEHLEELIIQYIHTIPEAQIETPSLDGEEILKSIESQHGLLVERTHFIYSFSHLTFQEYFTALYLYVKTNKKNKDKNSFCNIFEHIIDRGWHEVFILYSGMLENADEFLLNVKNKANMLTKDVNLQKFLLWLKNKTTSAKLMKYNPAAIRSCYIAFAHAHPAFFGSLYSRDLAISLVKDLDNYLATDIDIERSVDLAYKRGQRMIFDKGFHQELIRDCILNFNLKFNNNSSSCLDDFLYLNKLIVECINYQSNVSKKLRNELLNTILLADPL